MGFFEFFKRKSKKTPKNSAPGAAASTNEFFSSDELERAYKEHGIQTNTVCMNDPDPEYSYSNESCTDVSWENVYSIKEILPSPGWEIAKVGIHVRTGKFYHVESRQKSYGVFLGGEDAYAEISQSEFCSVTGRDDITEDNSLRYVPNELKKLPDAPKLTEKICSFNGINDEKREIYDIAFLSVTIERRFGTDEVRLVKYKDGYRAIHEYESHDFPDKKASRHLSETEVSYVIDALPIPISTGTRTGSADISLYGGETIDAFCILTNGKYFYFGNKQYALTVFDRLKDAAKSKLIFKNK